MNLLATERASLTLGPHLLLDEVSLGIGAGDRIGVVGRNGGGKTSLLNVLAGRLTVQSGRVTRQRDLTIGYVTQSEDFGAAVTVGDVVLAGHDEAWAATRAIRTVVTGLLGDLDAGGLGGWEREVAGLSGGERRRLALAAALVADPDLLLLDEPTNHLDLEAITWLATYLATERRASAATVTVTHDRWFLDASSTATWEVGDGAVTTYDGGYAAYVLAKAERERLAAVTTQRRANLLRKELAWLRRGAPARTSKPKFRLDAAAALIANEPPPRDSVQLARFAASRLGKDVIDLLGATLQVPGSDGSGGADADSAATVSTPRTLLHQVTWRLAPGERVGLLGPNGAGKTTTLRALLGEVPLVAGKLKIGKTVVPGFLSQDLSELDEVAHRSVIDAVQDVARVITLGGKEVTAARLATMLGFVGERQFVPVGSLSGGERRRLQLLRILMAEPNVLLLDEPTNDLDIETLTAIEDVLDSWAGTLVVVSHDRYLIERMTDTQLAIRPDGTLRHLPGGVDEYLALRARHASGTERTSAPGAASSGSGSTSANTSTTPQGDATSSNTPSTQAARQARKDMARIERALGRLERETARLHTAMAEVASDHAQVMALDAELRAVRTQVDELEAEWLAAAEMVESAS